MPDASSSSQSRSPWPMGIVLGLGTVVATNITMVVIAIQNPSVPETTAHWEESLAFNQEFALREQSAERGWTLSLDQCSELDEQGQCTLSIRVLDQAQRPVRGLSGTVRLRRDDETVSDREVPLTATEHGYAAQFEMGKRGSYRVELRTMGSDAPWRGTGRITLEPLPFHGRRS